MLRMKRMLATLAVLLGASALDAEWTIDNPFNGQSVSRDQTIAGAGEALGGDPTRVVKFQRRDPNNSDLWLTENEGTAVRQFEESTGYAFWVYDLSPPTGGEWTPSPLNEMEMPEPDHRYVLMEGQQVVAAVVNMTVT